jgi:preprotein translocase subunit YajC
MEYNLILAQSETGDPVEITSEPVSEAESSTQQPSDANAPAAGRGARGMGNLHWIFLILIIVMMYMMLFHGPRKKQQQHQKMVKSLKKNDRVRTIGGIIGTVVDVKGDEIVLKVDESNNTKIRIVSSAIGRNLTTETE